MNVQIPGLWMKFKKKFGLVIQQPQAIGLDTSVQPVTVIDLLVEEQINSSSEVAISGTGNKHVFTVPVGEKWVITSIGAEVVSGTMTLSHIIAGQSWSRAVDLVLSPGTQRLASGSIVPFVLEPGWYVYTNVDTFAAAGNIKTRWTHYVL